MELPDKYAGREAYGVMPAKASAVTERVALTYAKHEFDPVELLNFVQLDGFPKDWKRLKLDDDDMQALRVMIATSPSAAPVISGTGGLRKLRFSPPQSHRGKSSGVRVCYSYFREFGIVLLVEAYSKNRKEDLAAGERRAIKAALDRFERGLRKGPLH